MVSRQYQKGSAGAAALQRVFVARLVVVEQEDVETVDRLDDVIKDAEDYYGVLIDYMSKPQLLSVIAKMMEVLGVI